MSHYEDGVDYYDQEKYGYEPSELYAGYWNGTKLEDIGFFHLKNILRMMQREDWPGDAIEIIETEIKDREISGAAAKEIFGVHGDESDC